MTEAGTRQEWGAGTRMMAAQGTRPEITVDADKGYDTGEVVNSCRGLKVTPHVARKVSGGVIDGRATNFWVYRVNQVNEFL